MLIFSKALMFLWAEAVGTACYNQNRSLIHTRHNKTPYELVHNKKPDLTFFRVFGALCYPTNNNGDLRKLQPTADIRIFIKDETPEVVIKFLQQIQVRLNKTVRSIRTDNGTEFVNQALTEYYECIGMFHQKTVPRTPQQNDNVERRNRMLVEAAQIILIFSKAPMFLWAKVVATACYTLNVSLIHTLHNKTPYELVHNKKPDLTFLIVFGALCYLTNDSEDLGKLQPTADIEIFVGYAPSRKGYRIYNKRTR
uniref:Retrovirus-related Pol polyprotein from transposon TNT 1-94 n=1 Tax=Tanacetum cinerariifolium TaxID=118510 RepID=A0A699II75_TANCI|nr:retrovirus-related Pol polyprotein from transposon TNT 1-94 [Tanacetum cinerariifolium]